MRPSCIGVKCTQYAQEATSEKAYPESLSCPGTGRASLAAGPTETSTVTNTTSNRACHGSRPVRGGLLPEQRRCLCSSAREVERLGSARSDCAMPRRQLFVQSAQARHLFTSWRSCE